MPVEVHCCNGQLDPGEPPIDAAVLTLDGGQRSELVRKGTFRVRSGEHRVELLRESLPTGAAIVGDPERRAAVRRAQPDPELTYLVRIEKRPEVRKVFPPRGGGAAPPAAVRVRPPAALTAKTAASKQTTVSYTVQAARPQLCGA